VKRVDTLQTGNYTGNYTMKTRIRKIGNSAGITLPKESMAGAGFIEGQEVHVVVTPGSITITSERHIDVLLSLDEAIALIGNERDSAAGKAARLKISKKLSDPK
jgi:antitoxin component of MazEF toxin-antitoxin module